VALDIVAFISVPLVKEGRLVGTLTVTTIAPCEWSAAQIALVQDVAERIWAAVERARAEMELRESEERSAPWRSAPKLPTAPRTSFSRF